MRSSRSQGSRKAVRVKTVRVALRRCGQQSIVQSERVRSNYLISTTTGLSDLSSGGSWSRHNSIGRNTRLMLLTLPPEEHWTIAIQLAPRDHRTPIEICQVESFLLSRTLHASGATSCRSSALGSKRLQAMTCRPNLPPRAWISAHPYVRVEVAAVGERPDGAKRRPCTVIRTDTWTIHAAAIVQPTSSVADGDWFFL